MKLSSCLQGLAGTALVLGACALTPVMAKTVTVDVTSIVEHPALDATADGVHEVLEEAGYTEANGLKWNFQTAQGNNAVAAQIARKYVGDNPDVIVAIATPSAQAVVAATSTIPVVYSTVTAPVAAQLVPSWGPSGTNVTGVSDALPLENQIDLIKKIVPDAKTVGMVYNPGEANSVSVVKKLRKMLPENGLKLVESTAPRTVDVGTAARNLVGKVDVIYVNTDNNVVSALESVVKVADENKIPLIASDTSSVSRGAVAALGVNYHNIGRQAGKMVVRILKGEDPGSIPSETSSDFELYLNRKAAKKQGVNLPEALVKSATKVID